MLTYRYPDNPMQVGPAVIYQLEKDEPGRHIGQFKYDGWRRPIYIDGGIKLFSKHDYQAKSEVPASLLEELKAYQFPDQTAFDSEWMGKRCTQALGGRHYFVLFDLMYFNGQWQGDLPYEERYKALKTLYELHRAKAKVGKESNIELISFRELNLVQMFEESKTMPLTEGIVVKDRRSKLFGGMTDCKKNGGWLKVKWRQ